MKAEDILAPKVFLCKASLFLEKLNENMGGDGVVKEKFGSEDFQVKRDNLIDDFFLFKRISIVFFRFRPLAIHTRFLPPWKNLLTP